jgi:transposase
MEAPTCPGCLERDARIAELERRVAELEGVVRDLQGRLGTNSTNSSVPPSANPLDAPKPKAKKKSKRKRGGQPGHPPHLKQLLPAERINSIIPYLPCICEHCQAPLPEAAGENDPSPTRFQTVELPPVVATVTEYQGHSRTCTKCGKVTHAPIPSDILAHSVGPRLTATLSYFTGAQGVSKRGVEEIAEAIFDAPVSLGTVANLEQEVSAALAAPHQEALEAVRAAPVKNADETSWKLRAKLQWLWAAATVEVVAFVIHAKRSALGLTALLGAEIQGILCSDRWGVYARVPAAFRQICWAHLKRDFQKIVDRDGAEVAVGKKGLKIVKKVFAVWHAFRDGQITRKELQDQVDSIANRMNLVLLEGAILGTDDKVKAFCDNVLNLESALWTFARVEGVEPTNNHIERLLRKAVLWRRRSFGCACEAGCRFVERILTVVQTKRLQGKSALDYLHMAVQAHRAGETCPKLLSDQ